MKDRRWSRALRCAALGLALLAGCPGAGPEDADAGGGGRDLGLVDVRADAAVVDTRAADLEQLDLAAPDTAAPDRSAPDGAVPDGTAPDATAPDAAQPDAMAPDAAQPDGAAPDATGPDAAQPDGTAPDATGPDATRPDVGDAPYIQVFSPNGGELLPAGFVHKIVWDSANLADSVDIFYSTDQFMNITLVAAGLEGMDNYEWIVPADLSDSVLVKVAASANPDQVFDVSDEAFSIVEASITVTSPNGGEVLEPATSYEITWTSEHMRGEVRIVYTTDDFTTSTEIVAATEDDGSFVWDPLPVATLNDVKVRVSAVENPGVHDASDAAFRIGWRGWARAFEAVAALPTPVAVNSAGEVYVAVNLPEGAPGFKLSKLGAGGEPLGSWGFSSGAPQVFDVAVDGDDSLYLLGECASTCDVDPGPAEHVLDFYTPPTFVAKLSALGELVWARGFELNRGGSIHPAFAVLGTSAVVVTGDYSAKPDFDSSPGGDLPEAVGQDAFVAVFTPANGAFSWARAWGGMLDDYGTAVGIDSDSRILVGGTFTSDEVDFDPGAGEDLRPRVGTSAAFAVRFLAGGGYDAARVWGGTGDTVVTDIAIDDRDHAYLIGRFGGAAGEAVDFDPSGGTPQELTLASGDDAFIVEYDASFACSRVWGVGGDGPEIFTRIAVCGTGDLRLVGGSASTDLDLDPGPAELIPDGPSSFGIALGADLTWSAAAQWGHSLGRYVTVACDAVGDTYVAGHALAGVELAPVHAPCLAASLLTSAPSAYVVRYAPDMCW